MLAGTEDVIGPLLTEASLRVSVKRDTPLVELPHRVKCESRSHRLVWEAEFRNISGEAAAHLVHGININFIPPSSGLTLSVDTLFHIPKGVRDRLGYQTLPLILSGELHSGRINPSTMHLRIAQRHLSNSITLRAGVSGYDCGQGVVSLVVICFKQSRNLLPMIRHRDETSVPPPPTK